MMKKLVYLAVLALAQQLGAQCGSTVPYFEPFNGLTANNQLPTCWATSNTLTCLTYSTPGEAAFACSSPATSFFYSEPVQLDAGVAYSITVWYKTSTGSANWTDLSIMIGASQSSVALSTITSTSGTVSSAWYVPLTGTFVASASMQYFFAVRSVFAGSSGTEYLYFDDLTITAPCSLAPNLPSFTVSSTSNTICSGNSITITATGGASNYSINGYPVPAVVSYTPAFNTQYIIQCVNAVTGCVASKSLFVVVNPLSPVFVMGTQNICSGQSGTIALASFTYAAVLWNTGASGNTITVSPTVSTVYQVTLTSSQGCTNQAQWSVTVHPLPNLTVSSSSVTLCQGDEIHLTADGASTYLWQYGNSSSTTPGITISPQTSMNITVQGTQLGCTATKVIHVEVNICEGIGKRAKDELRVFPNPASDHVYIECTLNGTLKIYDALGMLVMTTSIDRGANKIDVSGMPPGLYFIKIDDSICGRIIK